MKKTNTKLQFLSLSDFEYELADNKIAKFPLSVRDESKLLFYNKGEITNHHFNSIDKLLPNKASLLFNKSKVVPARLEFFKETGTKIEVFLLEPFNSEYNSTFNNRKEVIFKTLIGNKKRWKTEEILSISSNNFTLNAVFVNRDENIVKLSWTNDYSFSEVLETLGKLPLPPYLHRNAEKSDYQNYQTIFAEEDGAVAAPTAALHFTEKVFDSLKNNNIFLHKMTLHVSAGTFLPVTADNVLDHPMHNEVFYFDEADIHFLFESDFLIPVGTTSLRMIESLFWMGVSLWKNKDSSFSLDKLFPYEQVEANINKENIKNALLNFINNQSEKRIKAVTRLMIVPGYKPQLCKGLITNFHQPASTLIMLVASLIGEDWRKVYKFALDNNYRFLSYGDSSLLIW